MPHPVTDQQIELLVQPRDRIAEQTEAEQHRSDNRCRKRDPGRTHRHRARAVGQGTGELAKEHIHGPLCRRV
jgi:hypothetical protein